MRNRRGRSGGGLWGGWTCLVRAESARAGTQADMFPVSSGAARSRSGVVPRSAGAVSRPWVTAYSGGTPEHSVNALSKRIVIQSKEEA
ncbi:hypothetical protein GCM10010216_23240 [Streptomyces flaveolus]|nr:hypothetical protein GCM10010216_23240 [Streptomyces flaveolus]